MGDLLEDAKYYQDAAFEYQSAYEALCLQQEELQSRYTQQAQLVEEPSAALRAAENESSQRYQEVINLQKKRDADIQHTINKAVVQYQLQLSTAKKQPAAERTFPSEAVGTGAFTGTVTGESGKPTLSGINFQ